MAPRMVMSSLSVPGQLGAGVNLQDVVEAVRHEVDLELFALAPYPGVTTHKVPGSRLAAAIARPPLVRRLTDLYESLSTRAFDGHVAGRLEPAAIVQAESGTALRTLRRARQQGAHTVLDCITTHIDNVVARQRCEAAVFGIRAPVNEATRRVRLEEYEAADVLRVPSEFTRSTFLERGVPPERVVVVRPVVEAEEFPRAGFEDEVFRVCSVGRLVPWKGFHHLIEAYERLALPDAELELWGGATSRPVARYLAEHAARTPSLVLREGWTAARSVGGGPSQADGIRAAYARSFGRASVFVHPTLADTWGYVVAEAMACGLPVIVTDQTGSAELVEDGVSGFVVPAGDPEAIAHRLRHFHAHRELLPEMGAAACRAVAGWGHADFATRYLPEVLGLEPSSSGRSTQRLPRIT